MTFVMYTFCLSVFSGREWNRASVFIDLIEDTLLPEEVPLAQSVHHLAASSSFCNTPNPE